MTEGSWRADGTFTVTDGHRVIHGWATSSSEVAEILRRADVPREVVQGMIAATGTTSVQYSKSAMLAATTSPQSSDSFFTTSIPQLLTQYLDDVRAEIPTDGPIFEMWVTSRAAELNQREPQVHAVQAFDYGRLPDLSDHESTVPGFGVLYDWVDPRRILMTAGDRVWNVIDRRGRDRVVEDICASLRDATTPHARRRWLEAISVGGFDSPVVINIVPGPAGAVYELSVNGVHRTHAARILGLPLMMAEVRIGGLPYETFPPDPSPAPIGERERLWTELHRRGVLGADVDEAGTWTIRDIRAEWMLLEPALAIETNRAYERLYPGALTAHSGLPLDALTDEDSWVAALQSSQSGGRQRLNWLKRKLFRSNGPT